MRRWPPPALIAAPFVLFYDLVLGSLAAAWLVRAASQDGFRRGEPIVLPLLMLASFLAAAPVVGALHIPFGALVGPALLTLAVRRRPGGPPS